MAAKRMREERFIDHVYDGYHAGERYCFILGAGASRSSGIRTGEQLMREWHTFLLERGEDYIRESAEDAGLALEEYEHLLSPNAKLNNKDYFTLYDLRFAGQASAAYDALEREMEGKQPGFGYYPLSMLLTNTENKLVITTNFDSLIEDAIYIYTHKHPLVVGHESLAGFIGSNARRPVIAKVHRDLFFSPMNQKKDMQSLAEGWEKPLGNALQRCIPIVIGYAGGDRTLMTFLRKLKLKSIYWCYVGQKPDDDICGVVEKNQGYLVEILGFDEIMFQLAERFGREISFNDPQNDIRDQAEQQCQNYLESLKKIKKNCGEKKKNELRHNSYCKDTNGMEQALDKFTLRQNAEAVAENQLRYQMTKVRIKIRKGEYQEAINDYSNLIAQYPDKAELYDRRSVVYYKIGLYEKDYRDISKAIELEPNNAEYYESRSETLHAMKRYDEALKDCNKAIELEPNNAEYYESRSETLHVMKRYDEALEDCNKAIELEPNNAEYYESRSETLHAMKRYEEALADDTKTIQLEPNNARHYYNRGATLDAMKRYEEALADMEKAIELEPNNAEYYRRRGVTLRAIKQYDEALKDADKSIELDSENALCYKSRSITYREIGEPEKAERDEKKAEELRSKEDKKE